MSSNKKVVAFIPVRGGSKSIPLKNIKNFCGNPLVYWVAKAAEDCAYIDEVYVATDSVQIRDVVDGLCLSKVKVIDRAKATATDSATTESAMLDFANKVDFDEIVLIQATSPLLTSEDLTKGYSLYQSKKLDSLLSVVPQRRFIWEEQNNEAVPQNYDPLFRPMRQKLSDYFVENGAFYITTRVQLVKTKCRISGKIGMYPMAENTYFEIDEPSDWQIMEQLKKKQILNAKKVVAVDRKIKLFITDVDGTLTDGGMYYDNKDTELKKFNTRDGKGIELLRKKDVKVMLLTSENNAIVSRRASKLHVDFCAMGVKDKAEYLNKFFRENKAFSWETTAYIGDDINDYDAIKRVTMTAAPLDAEPEIRDIAIYQCERKGGDGCVREFIHYLQENKLIR